MSFIEKLESTIYLSYVLKVVGVIILAVAFFYAWHQVSWGVHLGFVTGPIAWFVGAAFNKIYK